MENLGAGISTIKSFHYSKNAHCVATLANGVKGVVGNATSCPLNVMLALHSANAPVKWTKTEGTYVDKAGATQPNYQLEWSLE